MSTETTQELKERLVEEIAPLMTQFELSLVNARHALDQWGVRCGGASGLGGFSSMDLLVLSMVGYGSKRVSDICFALNIEDTHIVAYALKKLQKAGLVESHKSGKESFFVPTEAGTARLEEYRATRKEFLIRDLVAFSNGDFDIETVTKVLRVLSGLYQQAARNVENSSAR